MKLIIILSLLTSSAFGFTGSLNFPLLNTIAKENIPLNAAYRQLRLAPLPKIQGRLNKVEVLLKASTSNLTNQKLTNNQRKQLRYIINAAVKNDLATVNRTWTNLIRSFKNKTANLDINSLIYGVIKESHLKPSKDLLFQAFKIAILKERKENLRNYLKEVQRKKLECSRAPACSSRVIGEIQNLFLNLKAELQSVEDESDIEMVSMQSSMQQRSQSLTMATNMLRSMHDSAAAIARNVR